ncbi:MAG: signal recognition particle-docking protein FtsY [archaeon]
MFKFLKDKLKSVVDKLKSDVEKEVEVKEVEKKVKVGKKPAKKKEVKKVEKKKEEKPKEKPKKEKKKTIKGVKITYFVHGTTTDNEEGLATGQKPGELSELGKKQVEELPGKVKDKKFDVMFSSDLKRAVESAKAFKDVCPLKKDKKLREADYGDLTQQKDFDKTEYIEKAFPSGESYKEVEKRIAEFLNYLLKNYEGKHVAIMAHHAPQLAIEVLTQGKTWEKAFKDDWRNKKEWQPGWEYSVEEEVEVPEIKKEGFLKKIFSKKEDKPEEEKEKIVEEEVEEQPEDIVKEEKEDEVVEEIKEEEPEEKKGFFKRITERVTTFNLSEEKFEEIFWELEVSLLENNVAVEVIEKIKADLKQELTTGKISRKGVDEVIKETLKKSIEEVLDVDGFDLIKKAKKKKPFIIAFIGVNGSGKTTTMAKIGNMFQKNGLSVVFAASDTFRAAAIHQLEEHANRLKIKIVKHDYNADPSAVAYDAIEHAKSKGIDVVMIDTAGRLHSNDNLMEELKKLIRVNKPDIKIFIGESITGNDCVEQARVYEEKVGIDAIVLAKADVDEKGGAAISVSYITKKPILFLGTGQTYDDLKKFDKKIILDSLGL